MKTGVVQWPGGEHEFSLPIGQLRALQDATNSGPEEVFNRLRLGTWRVNDVIDTIRLGLVGSGAMTSAEAGPFVTNLFECHPKAQFKLTAITILAASLLGVEEDPVGEDQGETSPPENGVSQSSTEAAQ